MAIWLVILIALLIAALGMGVMVICAAVASSRAKARREPDTAEQAETAEKAEPAETPVSAPTE